MNIRSKFALGLLSLAMMGGSAMAQSTGDQPVTVTEDATSFTMSNGIVTAKVLKRNGDLASLLYKGVETLTDKSGHAGGYWSHDANSPTMETKITIDPNANGGARAEVSVKGISNGRRLGRPAGLAAGAEGDFPADIEIRYSVGRGESGTYTYCILDHKPEYPAGSIGEARYCAKLAAMYDWMSIDEKRNKYYPKEIEGEDKYVYTALQSENLAYGFSSTTQKTGWYIINPTIEYLSGGPTKVEFLCHRDTTAVEAPCVLNYWRSSHYGGAVVNVEAGEKWTKVIGPFMIYVNSGEDPMAMWNDARAKAKTEAKKWPYNWVNAGDYLPQEKRSAVSGQLVLNDPLMPGGARFLGNLTIGLTGPAYTFTPAVRPPTTAPARGANAGFAGRGPATGPATGPAARGGRRGAAPAAGGAVAAAPAAPQPRTITWQTDAKHYQYWSSNSDATGKFTIEDVRPGTYTLYAYADGVLGELAHANVTIPEGGAPVNLGSVKWEPVRRGKQLWEVGIPNRTAKEFAGGDFYFDPDTQIRYAKLFPDDVNFIVGKSDFRKDWYYEHIPHNVDPAATIVPFSGVRSAPGRATPYRITFDLPEAPKGKATLRLAFASASAPNPLKVDVNGAPAGEVARLNSTGDSTIVRHNIQGVWFERELSFDATMMKQGQNQLTLTIPEGSLNNGVIYDAVRLELDEAAK